MGRHPKNKGKVTFKTSAEVAAKAPVMKYEQV